MKIDINDLYKIKGIGDKTIERIIEKFKEKPKVKIEPTNHQPIIIKDCQLYLADCLEVLRQLPDKSVDMILQDPPYNTTACKWEWDIMEKIDEFWVEWKRVIKDNGAIVMTASQPFTSKLVMSNLKMFKYEWVWEKEKGTGFQIAKYRPMMKSEGVLVFCKTTPKYNPQMIQRDKPIKYRYPTVKSKSNPIANYNKSELIISDKKYPENIIRFKTERGIHPTQKPIALMEYLIKTYTNEGDTVFDGFIGSGTTGVACKNLNRNFIGVELDENYFKVAEERIKKC